MANYIDKAEFYAEMVEHWPKVVEAKQNGLPMPTVSDGIAMKFYLIVENTGKRYNFNRYSFLDDMKTRALIVCLSKAHCFNPEKSNNPFGYFSRVVWQEFVNEIKDEQDQSYIKAKLFYGSDSSFTEGEFDDNEAASEAMAVPFFDVEEYERKNGIKNSLTKSEARIKINPHKNTTGPLLDESEDHQ